MVATRLSACLALTCAALGGMRVHASFLSDAFPRLTTLLGSNNVCEVADVSGQIQDSCCDVETVQDANEARILPILHRLTKTTYFRYFKVDLWRQCPFWEEDGVCFIQNCAVCECDQSEVPVCWEDGKKREDVGATDQTSEVVAELSRVHNVTDAPGRSPSWALASGGSAGSTPAPVEVARTPASGDQPGAAVHDASVWMEEDEDSPELKYVNLLSNPEGYTGYAGPAAARVWSSIYSENCFSRPFDELCVEERVFFRLLSGLQTSINTHIAMTYGEGKGSRSDVFQRPKPRARDTTAAQLAQATAVARSELAWLWLRSVVSGQPAEYATALSAAQQKVHDSPLILTPGIVPNVDMYLARIGRFPERIQNLYFVYVFLTRALAKAQPLLHDMHFATGSTEEDAYVKRLVTDLLDAQLATPALAAGFNESSMFLPEPDAALPPAGSNADAATCADASTGAAASDLSELLARHNAAAAVDTNTHVRLRESWREKYRNISRIMDCVGCEKCRLWGKLQFLGLGTAMKILFAPASGVNLSRNEVVALVNVFHRVSMSISAVQLMTALDGVRKANLLLQKGVATLLMLAIAAGMWRWLSRASAAPHMRSAPPRAP